MGIFSPVGGAWSQVKLIKYWVSGFPSRS